MIKKLFFNFLLIVLSFAICNSALAQDDFSQKINVFIKQSREKYGVSAISLSVVFPDGTEQNFENGTIDYNSNVLIAQQNLFWMNSITKSFTAALALKLINAGQLNLNEPITNYLPEYKNWNNITVKELLNQTSGIYDYIDSPGWFDNLVKDPNRIWQPEELVAIAYKKPLYFKPGTGWHYSNTNYVLLGMIIANVTGKSMDESFSKQFFIPLKLDQTFYIVGNVPNNIKNKLVHGYYQTIDVTNQNPSWSQAAGGIISNTGNMAMWFHDLMSGEVLSNSEFSMMTTLVSDTTGAPVGLNTKNDAYGMGIFYGHIDAEPLWFVPGLSSGYSSLVIYLPRQHMTYAVAINSGSVINANFVKDMLIVAVKFSKTQ